MDLNGLVFSRLSSDPSIARALAKYDDQPAIFNTEFPADQQDGWGGETQYPRISYRFNMQVDTKRSSSGTLMVSIFALSPIIAEEIEMYVRNSLKDVLMKPTGEAPVCVAWQRTDPFLLEGNKVYANDITFDILEFPAQETTDPDPVMALSYYIKDLFPDSAVLGVDEVGDYTSPADTPIFYCQLQSITLTDGPCQNTVMWFIAGISVHLLCPDASNRLKMVAAINQRLAIDAEVIMLDDSPMTIQSLRMDNRADYLREGQLVVSGHYGCLRDGAVGHNTTGISLSTN